MHNWPFEMRREKKRERDANELTTSSFAQQTCTQKPIQKDYAAGHFVYHAERDKKKNTTKTCAHIFLHFPSISGNDIERKKIAHLLLRRFGMLKCWLESLACWKLSLLMLFPGRLHQ